MTGNVGSKLAFLHKSQREENYKLVRIGQFCTLFPEGGVVWKIPYRRPGHLGSYWVIRCYKGSFRVYRNRLRCYIIRDWLLIMWEGGGGLQNGRGGGTLIFTPTKRGGGKSFSHAESGGGAQQVLG